LALKAQFAVRAETHEIAVFIVGLPRDKNETGSDVTIPVILPVPDKRVIDEAWRHGRVAR
jgi:hypothetical protein